MKISSMKMRMGPDSHLPFQLWWRTGQAPGKGPHLSLRKDSVTARAWQRAMNDAFVKRGVWECHQFVGDGLCSPLKVIQGWMYFTVMWEWGETSTLRFDDCPPLLGFVSKKAAEGWRMHFVAKDHFTPKHLMKEERIHTFRRTSMHRLFWKMVNFPPSLLGLHDIIFLLQIRRGD